MGRIRDFFRRNWEGFTTKLIYDVVKWALGLVISFVGAILISRKWDFLGMIPTVGGFRAFVIYLCMTVGAISILYRIGRFALAVAKRRIGRSKQVAKEESARSKRMAQEKQAAKEALRRSISTLDDYEKAVLREFFIQKRSAILVPEEDIAVAGLLQKGIIRIIGDGKQVLGVGWVYPVELSPSAAAIIKDSSPQIIGFPLGMSTPEQVKKIQGLRPSFVWDIECSSW